MNFDIFIFNFRFSIFRFQLFLVILHAELYANMKLLLILLNIIMSFTVTSYNSVSGDGTFPYDMEVNYANTYNKGQVRLGDTAVIALSHLEGINVAKIEVEMKGNKDSGKGTFYVKENGQLTAQKNIANLSDEWVTVDLMVPAKDDVDAMEIMLVGTENSLYINKYIIHYDMNAPNAVTLMKGNNEVDVLTGSTVTLPALEDEGDWNFIGWTTTPFYVQTERLENLIPVGTYQPETDCTLWATYQYAVPLENQIVTELNDGVYIYANTSSGRAMRGDIRNGKTDVAAIDMSDYMQWYEVLFDEEGLATIRLLYVYGEAYIGFEGTKLVDKPSKWNVYHEGQKTAFYTMVSGQTYILFPDMLQNDYETYSAQLVKTSNISDTPTALLLQDETITMTCYPEIGYDLETISDDRLPISGEWYIPLGNYRLVIKDGKKQLELW